MEQLEITHLVLRYTRLRIMDPGRIERLVASLSREGQRSPVLVTADRVLIDGYHRVQALEDLGRDVVEAVTLEVDPSEALVLTWRLERGHRRTALEESWLLAELTETHHKTLAELASQMHRSKSWISERLGLLRALPESVQDAVRAGKVPANAAMKSLVPFARADPQACEAMIEASQGPLTVRQVARLYGAWRKADEDGRERIVAHPMLFLKTEDAVADVPLDLEEQLARDFESIAGLCRRARRRTQQGAFPRGNATTATRAWTQAVEGFVSLKEEVRIARS